jgi:hypothetical protein
MDKELVKNPGYRILGQVVTVGVEAGINFQFQGRPAGDRGAGSAIEAKAL